MADKLKNYETIGCCGIDCGLCPRFHTNGDSACPGCGGFNFQDKHPSCGFLTCCVIKKGLEVCSDCKDYPCKRFDSEKEGYDSFVTHKMVFTNLEAIKANGIESFIENQSVRIDILNYLLQNFDDGRSKSFFCTCCALLPLEQLKEVFGFANTHDDQSDTKEKCRQIKDTITKTANNLGIDLRLKKNK